MGESEVGGPGCGVHEAGGEGGAVEESGRVGHEGGEGGGGGIDGVVPYPVVATGTGGEGAVWTGNDVSDFLLVWGLRFKI